MASEIQASKNNKKRKSRGGGGKMKMKPQGFPGGRKPKIDKRTKRLFQKRARNYNSDTESEEDDVDIEEKDIEYNKEEEEGDLLDGNGDLEEKKVEEDDDDEEDAIQPGIIMFSEGSIAFNKAFKSIARKNVADDLLGPVLSGHKKLIAEKLAEDESERAVKGVAKKEKLLLAEKGHVKPANFLDSHEKFLIGVATKGVVKLFNAVNKAQNAQKGLNPSSFKDAKELGKRKKQAFFTELRKKTTQGTKSTAIDGSDEPAWAPLRDSYMLTNSKLKNWDKMPDKTADDDMGNALPHGSSSDED